MQQTTSTTLRAMAALLGITWVAFSLAACGTKKDSSSGRPTGSFSRAAAWDSIPELPPDRLVTIGGDITETVFRMGMGDKVVAVDKTSYFPKSVRSLKKVGYMRTLASEGIMALKPSGVLASAAAGPTTVFEQLRRAGIPCAIIPEASSLQDIYMQMEAVGKSIGKPEKAEALKASLKQHLKSLKETLASVPKRKRVAVFTGFQSASFSAAGYETEVDLLIETAGATNVFYFSGWKTIGAEGLLQADPDAILVLATKTKDLNNAVFKRITQDPALKGLKAVRSNQVYTLDYLVYMQLGPRIGQSAEALARLLYPKLKKL